jgi:putative tryptophan/tyrosine transport system substrate-binding protein
MKRREFITLLGGAAAWPLVARAQQSGKVARIGYLSPGSASDRTDVFRQGLREVGYVEKKNILIEYRFAEGNFDRLADLAAQLVQLKVDVIVAEATQASLAAKDATRTIPIVMLIVADPVGSRLVGSLARPGANITGTSSMTAEVAGKSLQLLKQVVPNASRAAVLWNPKNVVAQAKLLQETEVVAAALGVQLQLVGVRGPGEFDSAFAEITRGDASALLVMADPILVLHKTRIVDFAKKSRLPAMYGNREYVGAGGLMYYGSHLADIFRRTATYVDKILKGAKPADLPVEQPTRFEFVVNLKTAKTLGLTIPGDVLSIADEVIE